MNSRLAEINPTDRSIHSGFLGTNNYIRSGHLKQFWIIHKRYVTAITKENKTWFLNIPIYINKLIATKGFSGDGKIKQYLNICTWPQITHNTVVVHSRHVSAPLPSLQPPPMSSFFWHRSHFLYLFITLCMLQVVLIQDNLVCKVKLFGL